MNSHEAYKINPQIIYHNQENAVGCSLNLLSFGYRQFIDTHRYQHIESFKFISENNPNKNDKSFNLALEFGIHNLMDNLKMIICFENFMKGVLLSNLYVVHNLNKEKFPELYKEQRKRPITIYEVLEKNPWENDNRIITDELNLKKVIKGITSNTLNLSTLLKPKYLEVININPIITEIIRKMNNDRNRLHFYSSESITFSSNSYYDFRVLIDFLNNSIVKVQNEMAEYLNMPNEQKIKHLTYPL